MASRNKRGTYGRGGLLKAQSLGELRQEGIDAGYDVDAGISEYMKTGNLDAAVTAGGGAASDAAMIDSYAEDNYDVEFIYCDSKDHAEEVTFKLLKEAWDAC